MDTIRVGEIIDTAFSMDDANLLSEEIEKRVHDGVMDCTELEIDFEGIRYYTTLFFNNAIVKYIGVLGFDDYSRQIKLINLSEVGRNTYQHSLDNAKDFYSLSEAQREELASLLTDSGEED